jgi:GNAT superfamily N-acetyltransferase
MPDDQIMVANAPEVPGLIFRHFRGESDYGSMATVLTESSAADGEDREVSGEDIATAFSKYITNCDPYKDMIFAEVVGETVGYARGWWTEESPTLHLYKHNGFLLPAWRRRGIGRAMLDWMEKRLKEISQTHPRESEKFLQVNLSQSQEGAAILMERAGYQPVRYFCLMVRPHLEDILDFPLPEELEIRPVTPDHYQAIWESMYETPGEEWGSIEPPEEAYREWLQHPHFQPQLWQIAWDEESNHPVGHVLTYIDHEENKQFDRKRGYTEGVGVSQEWRRQGIARTLISLSLQAQKAAGMRESALVADSQSAFGVTRLYESCGFQIVNRDTVYRKPFS